MLQVLFLSNCYAIGKFLRDSKCDKILANEGNA